MLGRYSVEVLTLLEQIRKAVLGDAIRDRRQSFQLQYAFDLVSGTSVGALLAGGIAAGVSPTHISSTMERFGEKIFPEKSNASRLSHLNTAWFEIGPLVDAVDATLGDRKDIRLSELDTHLAVPALNESTGEPVIFSTLNPNHLNLPLKDIVLASAAAPLYLPAWKISENRFVDGGLFANAPDFAVIKLLQKHAPNLQLENISIVSVGTTNANQKSPIDLDEDGNWGLKRWLASPVPARLIKLILAAQTQHLIELVRLLPLDCYERIDTVLSGNDVNSLGLDNASSMALRRLQELAINEFDEMSDDRKHRIRTLVSRTSPSQFSMPGT